MKTRSRSLLISLASVMLLTGLLLILPTEEDTALYDKVIRLHVLANSDSEEDQTLKLKVRDAILNEAAAMTEGCGTREEAALALSDKTDTLRQIAEETLRKNGCEKPVAVTIGEEHYPTRAYEGLRLPAGDYCSLRVMIGEAEGQNWWCVLFPPLCVGSASETEEEMISVGFTPGQVKILTDGENPRYVLKFKILEILGSLFS